MPPRLQNGRNLSNWVILAFAWVNFCLSTAVFLQGNVYFQAIFFAVLILALVRPSFAVACFVLCMPWLGGGQPGDGHTLKFLTLLSGLCLGTLLQTIVRSYQQEKLRFEIEWRNPLVFAVLMYWLVTALSVVGVDAYRAVRGMLIPNRLLSSGTFGYSEVDSSYPWVSFLILSQVTWLFLWLYNRFRNGFQYREILLQLLCLGALISVVVGILDYFDIVSLASIRPAVGNSFKNERLVSLFGNPTWYAQFLTLAAPSILSILFFQRQGKAIVGLMLLVMVITEFCILLINQRGGWLAYPLTLVVIWVCIYVLRESDDVTDRPDVWAAVRKSWIKIALALPVTLAISFTIIFWVAEHHGNGEQHVLGFVERAKTIKNYNDRLAFLEPSLKLAGLNPILGSGVDSFSYQYEQSFMVPGHRCVHDDPYTHGGHGTAHNLYFQTLAGKGVVGLLSLLGVMLAAFAMAWRGVLRQQKEGALLVDRSAQVTLMMGLADRKSVV